MASASAPPPAATYGIHSASRRPRANPKGTAGGAGGIGRPPLSTTRDSIDGAARSTTGRLITLANTVGESSRSEIIVASATRGLLVTMRTVTTMLACAWHAPQGRLRVTQAQANGVALGPRERRRTGLHKGHASAGEQGCTSICSVDATRHSVSGAGLEGPLLARQRAAYTAHAVDDDARGVDAWQNGDESGEVGGLIKGFKRRAQSRREADRRDQLTPRRQSGRRREWRRRRRRREKWGWRWRRRRRRRRRRLLFRHHLDLS